MKSLLLLNLNPGSAWEQLKPFLDPLLIFDSLSEISVAHFTRHSRCLHSSAPDRANIFTTFAIIGVQKFRRTFQEYLDGISYIEFSLTSWFACLFSVILLSIPIAHKSYIFMLSNHSSPSLFCSIFNHQKNLTVVKCSAPRVKVIPLETPRRKQSCNKRMNWLHSLASSGKLINMCEPATDFTLCSS